MGFFCSQGFSISFHPVIQRAYLQQSQEGNITRQAKHVNKAAKSYTNTCISNLITHYINNRQTQYVLQVHRKQIHLFLAKDC